MLTHFVSLAWCEHLNQGEKRRKNFMWFRLTEFWDGQECAGGIYPGADSGPQVLMEVNSVCNL